jgi:SAM-dependent methyltransferase
MKPLADSAGAAAQAGVAEAVAARPLHDADHAALPKAGRGGPLSPDAAWHALHRAACEPYRRAGRFAWHFARGKLGRDPAFRSLLERGELRPGARVVDIGCGQGLLASLLREVDRFEAEGHWPAAWPTAPSATVYTGLDLLPRDVQRAEAALVPGTSPSRTTAHFVCADMVGAELPACDTVVILDVLHYVGFDAQERVLREVRRALQPGGRLLMRVGDASAGRAFAITHAVDRAVTLVRSGRFSPMCVRPLGDWIALLQRLGFEVQSLPMSRGTPFANVLLVADRGASA